MAELYSGIDFSKEIEHLDMALKTVKNENEKRIIIGKMNKLANDFTTLKLD